MQDSAPAHRRLFGPTLGPPPGTPLFARAARYCAAGARGCCTALALFCAGAPLWAPIQAQAQAQPYPNHPVRVIAPFSPGGSADTLGRIVAQKLSESLKQPFVIENRGGAGGLVGSEIVAKAPPDGYTLVVSGVASHIVALALAKPPPFDGIRDFTHIALLGGPPIAVIVNPQVPAKDVKSLAAWAHAQKAAIPYGSPGVGTHGQLIAEMLGKAINVELIHAPYKGASGAVSDLIAGQIQLASITLNTAGPQLRAGKARAIAFTSRARIEDYPEVPTFTELGYPQLVASTWFSLSGPAKMPEEIAVKLNAEVRKALTLPDVKERFRSEGIETAAYDVPGFNKFVAEESKRWTGVVRASGAKAE
jgi:tripartite-type tricarboxylate transporter receptor subunit TctC